MFTFWPPRPPFRCSRDWKAGQDGCAVTKEGQRAGERMAHGKAHRPERCWDLCKVPGSDKEGGHLLGCGRSSDNGEDPYVCPQVQALESTKGLTICSLSITQANHSHLFIKRWKTGDERGQPGGGS